MPRILVVEDEEQVRAMLAMLFEREGYEVEQAADGNEALQAYKRQRADVIVTDLIMPDSEGIEMIIEIRTLDPEAKIIAISGGGRIAPQTHLDLAKRLGAAYTFAKPIPRSEMLEAVESLLEGKAPAGE